MRILAATPYYEPEGGGLERYAHATLRRLAMRGHDVTAVAYTRGPARGATPDGLAVELVRPAWRAGNTPIGGAFATRFRAAIRRARPDVVVLHTPVPSPALAAGGIARQEGVPYVVTYHAGRLRGSSAALDAAAALARWTAERRLLTRAAGLIAVSPYVRDNALGRHKDRVTVIPPGVDTRQFAPSRGCAGATVLFLGPLDRSYRWKGLDVLWDAFRAVRERRPDAVLRLVGEGDRAGEFRDRASTLPPGAVHVMPRVPADRLPRLYQDATVTVLPSTTDAESFGMVLAEANACGRPVVGSAVGGIPGFVRDGDNGFLARPGDPYDLAQRILAVLDDPETAQAMGRRGRERVLRDHDWGRLTITTEAVLQEAAGRSVAAPHTQGV